MAGDPGAVSRPTLAVWKFASCDGCQLTVLDCEDELLALAGEVDIAYFPEASRAMVEGPVRRIARRGLDHDGGRRRADPARSARASRALITIGACATAGGIQALRNFADVDEFVSIVYARPEYISTLATSTPIAAHVPVDFELRGCPIDKRQLLEVIGAHLNRRAPRVRAHSVCIDCKRRGHRVRDGRPRHAVPGPGHPHRAAAPCARPTTAAATAASGRWRRPNTAALSARMGELGAGERDLVRVYRTFNAGAAPFREESEAHEHG